MDAPRRQEVADAVDAGLAVDVLVVVVVDVEGLERLAVRSPSAQEVVEHLLPGRGVDAGRLGEHPVEVEQAGPDAVGGRSDHDPGQLPDGDVAGGGHRLGRRPSRPRPVDKLVALAIEHLRHPGPHLHLLADNDGPPVADLALDVQPGREHHVGHEHPVGAPEQQAGMDDALHGVGLDGSPILVR